MSGDVAQGWKTVSNSTPPNETRLLLYDSRLQRIVMGYFGTDFFFVITDGEYTTSLETMQITHWDTLPEPPVRNAEGKNNV